MNIENNTVIKYPLPRLFSAGGLTGPVFTGRFEPERHAYRMGRFCIANIRDHSRKEVDSLDSGEQ